MERWCRRHHFTQAQGPARPRRHRRDGADCRLKLMLLVCLHPSVRQSQNVPVLLRVRLLQTRVQCHPATRGNCGLTAADIARPIASDAKR